MSLRSTSPVRLQCIWHIVATVKHAIEKLICISLLAVQWE